MKKVVLGLIVMLSVFAGTVRAANFEQGVHYFEVLSPQPVQTGDKIEVLELFWYGCPHCFRLEPVIETWLETGIPDNAQYVRLPAVLNPSWGFHSRVYYTFEALGALDALHPAFFDEIHVRRKRMNNIDQVAAFAERYNIGRDTFESAYNSFAVDSKARHAQLVSRRYDATGVPAFVVDGKYRASVSSAGGPQELMQLVNFLVEKAAAERDK